MSQLNRRLFLNGLAASSGLAGMTSIFAGAGHAADTTGYKALVCVFLKGGLDHADTILPLDADEYDALSQIRLELFNAYTNAGDGSRTLANLLELAPDNPEVIGGRRIGLPQQLSPLKDIFDAGELAVVGGVGPLIEPTTRTTFDNNSVELPKKLFSHNDQQSTWMSLAAEGERFGWGGRFLDAAFPGVQTSDRPFVGINVGSADVFLSAPGTRPYNLPSGNIPLLRAVNNRNLLGFNSQSDAARVRLREALIRQDFSSNFLLERDLAFSTNAGVLNNEEFAAAADAAGSAITTVFPETGLGRQLRTAAQAIAIRDQLGLSRQIFYATLGGFDTHANQRNDLPGLQTQVADAIAAFRTAMIELGAWNNVTVFTASDFGRTLGDNGNGTDHGWGAHHFVAGGMVDGRKVFGEIARPDLDAQTYTSSRGRLIPSVSVEQYGATLGTWFGLDSTEINAVFPRLPAFSTGNLGFML